jgi:predicted Zn-dependent protease with MMP-like domain
MRLSEERFNKYVEEAFDSLSEEIKDKLNNVAILVEDYPTKEQLHKVKLAKDAVLFGLFEGYGQAKKINFGPVLPDRITLFRKAILNYCDNDNELKRQIANTLKHEIAHHFGSDESGARKASKK